MSYKQLNGYLVGGPPAYQYEGGYFLLAAWGPVVKPEDFPYPEFSAPIFGNLRFDLHDRTTRSQQRWLEGGLIENINHAIPDIFLADWAAKETAITALKRDPEGIVKLMFQGFADYWRQDILKNSMITDRGSDRELPSDLLRALRSIFHLEAENFPYLKTVTNA